VPAHIADNARRVNVDGRDEVGIVVDGGKNVGTVYCVGVYFPSTGEVAYFEKGRERDVEP